MNMMIDLAGAEPVAALPQMTDQAVEAASTLERVRASVTSGEGGSPGSNERGGAAEAGAAMGATGAPGRASVPGCQVDGVLAGGEGLAGAGAAALAEGPAWSCDGAVPDWARALGLTLQGPRAQGTGPDRAQAGLAAVQQAETLFDAVAKDLARIVGGLQDAPETPGARGREVTDVVREMRKALQTVIEERNKVEQLRREMAGGVGDRDIDLRSARDVIGRRLALLRHARGD